MGAHQNRKRIDDAYPVRVKIKIPRNGLGNLFGEIHAWLMALGPGRAANQSNRGCVLCLGLPVVQATWSIYSASPPR